MALKDEQSRHSVCMPLANLSETLQTSTANTDCPHRAINTSAQVCDTITAVGVI